MLPRKSFYRYGTDLAEKVILGELRLFVLNLVKS
jgi:hypothetical protein